MIEYEGEVIEYRVWVNPKHGEDGFYRSKSIEEALKKRSDFLSDSNIAVVEPVIAVVYAKNSRNIGKFRLMELIMESDYYGSRYI